MGVLEIMIKPDMEKEGLTRGTPKIMLDIKTKSYSSDNIAIHNTDGLSTCNFIVIRKK